MDHDPPREGLDPARLDVLGDQLRADMERPLRRRSDRTPPFVRGFVWALALALTIGAFIGPDDRASRAPRDPSTALIAGSVDATDDAPPTLAALSEVAPASAPRTSSDATFALQTETPVAAPHERAEEPLAAELQRDASHLLVVDVLRPDLLPAADLLMTISVLGGRTWTVQAQESPVTVALAEESAPHDGDIAVEFSVEARGEARSKLVSTRVPATGRRTKVTTRGAARLVSVRVVDEDATPIADAEVVLEASGGAARAALEPGVTLTDNAERAFTAADGRTAFASVPARIRRLVVTAPGFVPTERLVEVALGDATVELVLSRGRTLTGVITLPSGEPAVGAIVQLCTGRELERGGAPRATKTARDGSYELTGVAAHPAAGAAHVFARHLGSDGRERAAVGLPATDPGGELRWDATVEADQAVEFIVQDGQGQPLPGRPVLVVVDARDAEVPYFRSVVPTDELGRARFDVLPLTDLDVFVQLGQADLTRVARISAKDRADLRAGPRALDVDAARDSDERAATGRLTGRFFDARGRPHAAAHLLGERDGETFSADVDAFTGSVVVDGLAEGGYNLQLVVVGQGVLDLGHRRIDSNETLVLAPQFTAPACPVFVVWGAQPPTPQRPWVIEFEPLWPTQHRIAVAVVVQPERSLALLPGRYSIVDERTGARTGVFDVVPGRPVPITLPRR